MRNKVAHYAAGVEPPDELERDESRLGRGQKSQRRGNPVNAGKMIRRLASTRWGLHRALLSYCVAASCDRPSHAEPAHEPLPEADPPATCMALFPMCPTRLLQSCVRACLVILPNGAKGTGWGLTCIFE